MERQTNEIFKAEGIMKATELRIGNLVQKEHHTMKWGWEVDVVDLEIMGEGENDYLKPIPLTAEWLEKLGFEQGTNSLEMKAWRHPNLKKTIVYHDGFGFAGEEQIPPLDYVHQIQNLHFALTGEELTVKELA